MGADDIVFVDTNGYIFNLPNASPSGLFKTLYLRDSLKDNTYSLDDSIYPIFLQTICYYVLSYSQSTILLLLNLGKSV